MTESDVSVIMTGFIHDFEAKAAPLEKEMAVANFVASISGRDEDYARAAELEIELGKVYASKEAFGQLEAIRKTGLVKDPLLQRQLDVLYDAFRARQLDDATLEALVRQQKTIESKFNTYRTEVDGKAMTDNEVESVLARSTDSAELRKTWEASKKIGARVAADVVQLAKLRNQAARQLGFANFQEMQLKLGEQDPAEMDKLFDELDRLTRDAFAQAKAEMDAVLAKRLGIGVGELMPWHYQGRFFQEAPKIYPADLDSYYQGRDLVDLTKRYFAGIGLPVDAIVTNSDLFEKPGKYQHAYCTDIDRLGDVRVVCNVKPNAKWMGTMLHEYGHAVYDKYKDFGLPWALRAPAHSFTTEAIAMLFGRFAGSPAWLRDMLAVPPAETARIAPDCEKSLRLRMLVFSRWAQVMYRFEKGLYANPDQDLNKLWWDLVEKYQLLRRPAGRSDAADWAAKIHVATVPIYYHNYMLGELLASQLYFTIVKNALKSSDFRDQAFVGRKEAGDFLRTKVFGPGARWSWNEMVRRATGEFLTPKYFARQYVGTARKREKTGPQDGNR